MSGVATLKPAQPWYKERWPWILMAGPAIVIVAGIITLWLAVVSNDGLVSDDYYKEGLAVNQQIKRDQGAVKLGLSANLMRSGEKLRLLLATETEGAVVLPQEVAVKFTHPTRAGEDQLVVMKSLGGGMYAGDLKAGIGGRWIVSLEDTKGEWRLQSEWIADSGEALQLSAK